MLGLMLCTTLVLLALGWVLYTNSVDRKIFERELEEDLADDPDDGE